MFDALSKAQFDEKRMTKYQYQCLIERTIYGEVSSWTLEPTSSAVISAVVTLSVTIQPGPQAKFELLLEPDGYAVSVQTFSTLGEALAHAARMFSIHKVDWEIADISLQLSH